MNDFRKIICMIPCAVMCLMLCACGSKESSPTENVRTVSMYDLSKAMRNADESLPDMSYASSSDENAADLFTYISELDYNKVDSYFMLYSSEGLADEMAVIAVKSKDDVKAAEATLKEHVQNRVKLYTEYDPSQTKRAENALVFTKDHYAVLIISNEQENVKTAFEDFTDQE